MTGIECRVLERLAYGLTDEQIAGRLGLIANTIAGHKARLYYKAGAANAAHAVGRWYRGELAEIGAPSPLLGVDHE